MTSKIYRSAQGKSVDLGTIMLQNEHVRAVGNMKVNARGDKLDSANNVIETKPQQIQKQNDRATSNVSVSPVHTSSKKSRGAKQKVEPAAKIHSKGHVANTPPPPPVQDTPPTVQQSTPPVEKKPVPEVKTKPQDQQVEAKKPATPPKSTTPATGSPAGGLAGAIARSREIKQELDRTRRQQAQDHGVRKI
jgi:outer membrane biosynthesis protein TonB